MLRNILGGVMLLALVAPANAQTAVAHVTIDTSKPGPEIDRHIYGQFAEHLGRGIYEGIWVGEDSKIPNIHGYRKDVVEALRNIHVPDIRWPGGCFADLYDWRDGIGPRAKRPVRINVHWGGVTEDNSFGTNEFMNFSELVGADAYVSLNVGSLTPYDNAEWLEYMTSDSQSSLANERRKNGRAKPWTVRFVGIGNETWGCGGNMRPEYAADVNRRYATFANTPLEMGTLKIASGSHDDNYDFAETMMRDGGKFDGLSVHYYTVPRVFRDKGAATGFPESEWASTLSHALHINEIVTKTSAIMDKYDPDKKIGLYVDEWGAWYDQEPGSHPRLPLSAEFAARRRGGGAVPQHFPASHRPGERRQYRPDDQCAAGDDPDRQGQDGADAHLSRLRPVPGLHGGCALSRRRVGTGLCPGR